MTVIPIRYVSFAWVACGVVRVVLGSSTSPVSYVFLGLFLLASATLVVAAFFLFFSATGAEERVESVCLCSVVLAFFAAAFLDAVRVPTLVFFVAAGVLAYVYARRIWNRIRQRT